MCYFMNSFLFFISLSCSAVVSLLWFLCCTIVCCLCVTVLGFVLILLVLGFSLYLLFYFEGLVSRVYLSPVISFVLVGSSLLSLHVVCLLLCLSCLHVLVFSFSCLILGYSPCDSGQLFPVLCFVQVQLGAC